jgi:hypothetical protein
MTLRITALLITCSLLASPTYCFAQELEDLPDSALTSEQWQQRVRDARRRAEEFVAIARARTAAPQAIDPSPSDKEAAEAADQRAMNDSSLKRGDIISTSKGFLVFVGPESDDHQPGDFLPVPNSQHRR